MRKIHSILILAAILCAASLAASAQTAGGASGYRPVNPQATPEARDLLRFLYSIKGEYTLAGQHNFTSSLGRYDSLVHSITGKYPVVWGGDLSFMAEGDSAANFQHCGPMNLTVPFDSFAFNRRSKQELRQDLINEAKRKYAEGRIITLMWHCCFPSEGDECDGSSIWRVGRLPSQEEWNSLVTSGTPLNNAWRRQVDAIVPCLKQLHSERIPVLWRPYHEMNGVWFWWCNKPGENGFKKLWIMMYDYLVGHHGLDNLLWVWNTNAPRNRLNDEAGPYPDFFPGTEYVDVLAADVYRRDYKQSHHDDLLAVGNNKLISLGEVGQLPRPAQYDAQRSWSWFMVWGYFIGGRFASDEEVRAIYHHPRTVTLDMIDFSGHTYKLRRK
ncbi:MAG: glycoside hydrolase family 26 protein [Tannerellaceae bacterium]|jgi:mannan endo-1,4-beta-mannosidase|nr:glycoside hydrolase family 26 protein [Tannerellaceae bacterium]